MNQHEEGTVKDTSGDRMNRFEEVFYQKVPNSDQELFGISVFKENLSVHLKKEGFIVIIVINNVSIEKIFDYKGRVFNSKIFFWRVGRVNKIGVDFNFFFFEFLNPP